MHGISIHKCTQTHTQTQFIPYLNTHYIRTAIWAMLFCTITQNFHFIRCLAPECNLLVVMVGGKAFGICGCWAIVDIVVIVIVIVVVSTKPLGTGLPEMKNKNRSMESGRNKGCLTFENWHFRHSIWTGRILGIGRHLSDVGWLIGQSVRSASNILIILLPIWTNLSTYRNGTHEKMASMSNLRTMRHQNAFSSTGQFNFRYIRKSGISALGGEQQQ